MSYKSLISLLMLLVVLGAVPQSIVAEDEAPVADVFIYAVYDYQSVIETFLYVPSTGEHRSLPINQQFNHHFQVSRTGLIAYTMDGDIYAFDTNFPYAPSTNITQMPDTFEVPLSWSKDGQYLAFSVFEPQQQFDERIAHIVVWDGEQSTTITSDGVQIDIPYHFVWSNDGRLAFFTRNGVYLWDGLSTVRLSRYKTWSPIWDEHNQLMFLADVHGVQGVYLWDGISTRNGVPDEASFINLEPDLDQYVFSAIWLDGFMLSPYGQLFRLGSMESDQRLQIYVLKDGELTNISQNPDMHNGIPIFSADGRWAFTTFFSSEQLLYVRDSQNNTLLVTEGQYLPAWSSDGYLVFCTYQPRWGLSVWDGEQAIELTQGYVIWGMWQQSEQQIICSSG